MVIMFVRVVEVFASVRTLVSVTRATSGMSVNTERVSVEMKPMPTCVMDMAVAPLLTIVIASADGQVHSAKYHCVLVLMQRMGTLVMDMVHAPRSISVHAKQVGVEHNAQSGC